MRVRTVRLAALAVPVTVTSLVLTGCSSNSTTSTSASSSASATATASGSGSVIAANSCPSPQSPSTVGKGGGAGGTPPSGGKPSGQPGAAGGGAGAGGGSSSQAVTGPSGYSLASGSVATSGKSYTASETNESAIVVSKTGQLTLTNPSVTSSGNVTSQDDASFYGLNAAVSAHTGGQISISGGTVSTTGSGANDLDAYGTGAKVTMTGGTLKATGVYAHGVIASYGSTIVLKDVTINTTGCHGAAVATDRGGGTVTVTGGTFTTSGKYSPLIYSTGNMTMTGLTGTATGSSAGVVEGVNSITLVNSNLTGATDGELIYQSGSGDASTGTALFTASGSTLTNTGGSAFDVEKTTAKILLKGGTKIVSETGKLLTATQKGYATLTADGETIEGAVSADSTGSVAIVLENGSKLSSTLTDAAITLSSNSTWIVTGNSTVTTLSGAVISGTKITNITGNGHTVTYDASASANKALGGKTYTLAGGGTLTPKK